MCRLHALYWSTDYKDRTEQTAATVHTGKLNIQNISLIARSLRSEERELTLKGLRMGPDLHSMSVPKTEGLQQPLHM